MTPAELPDPSQHPQYLDVIRKPMTWQMITDSFEYPQTPEDIEVRGAVTANRGPKRITDACWRVCAHHAQAMVGRLCKNAKKFFKDVRSPE